MVDEADQAAAPGPLHGDDWEVRLAHLSREGRDGAATADEDARQAVADLLGAVACEALTFRWRMTPLSRARWRLRGTLEAQIVQSCVVTLEPVESAVSEPVEAIFDPAVGRAKASGRRQDDAVGTARQAADHAIVVDVEDDIIEPIENGRLRFGDLVFETLSLALDPYPHAQGVDPIDLVSETTPGQGAAVPGAVPDSVSGAASGGPFAGLAALRPSAGSTKDEDPKNDDD